MQNHLRQVQSIREQPVKRDTDFRASDIQQERDEITQNSVNDLMFNNPDEIVTACPLCLKTFAKKSPVAVKDIAEIVSEKL